MHSSSENELRFKYCAALLCMVIFWQRAFGQEVLKGQLLNKADSTPVPFAAILAKEINRDVLANENGEFSFSLPGKISRVTLQISAIGCNATIVLTSPFHKTERIYVDVATNPLNEVARRGLSAGEIVRKAVKSIPDNYADSSYFCFSYYRRYQKLNNRYVNLYEAQPAVMFRLNRAKTAITSIEAFAVKDVRSSKFYPNISNVIEDNPEYLLLENPVYHLQASSLWPDRLSEYVYSFDTTTKSQDYVINYTSNNFSSETHGILDYADRDLKGEIGETGQLVIDRESFAIKKYHRIALRHDDYIYHFLPPQNNKVSYGYHEYFFEFRDADLFAEYEPINGRWYLKHLTHRYRNDFYIPVFNTKDCSIEDFFEWSAHSDSRYVTKDFVDKFYPVVTRPKYDYDRFYWDYINFPFYYASKESVYKDLERDGPVEDQFKNECEENNERIDENTRHHK